MKKIVGEALKLSANFSGMSGKAPKVKFRKSKGVSAPKVSAPKLPKGKKLSIPSALGVPKNKQGLPYSGAVLTKVKEPAVNITKTTVTSLPEIANAKDPTSRLPFKKGGDSKGRQGYALGGNPVDPNQQYRDNLIKAGFSQSTADSILGSQMSQAPAPVTPTPSPAPVAPVTASVAPALMTNAPAPVTVAPITAAPIPKTQSINPVTAVSPTLSPVTAMVPTATAMQTATAPTTVTQAPQYRSEFVQNFLGREITPQEQQQWQDYISSNQLTDEQIQSSILQSPEALSNSRAAFVQNTLGRAITPQEQQQWADYVSSGKGTNEDIENYILNSQEAAKNEYTQFLRDEYTGLLGREPKQEELDYVIPKLMNEEITQEQFDNYLSNREDSLSYQASNFEPYQEAGRNNGAVRKQSRTAFQISQDNINKVKDLPLWQQLAILGIQEGEAAAAKDNQANRDFLAQIMYTPITRSAGEYQENGGKKYWQQNDPKDPKAQIAAKAAFSAMNTPGRKEATRGSKIINDYLSNPDDPKYALVNEIAKDILEGKVQNPTPNQIRYRATYVHPSWINDKDSKVIVGPIPSVGSKHIGYRSRKYDEKIDQNLPVILQRIRPGIPQDSTSNPKGSVEVNPDQPSSGGGSPPPPGMGPSGDFGGGGGSSIGNTGSGVVASDGIGGGAHTSPGGGASHPVTHTGGVSHSPVHTGSHDGSFSVGYQSDPYFSHANVGSSGHIGGASHTSGSDPYFGHGSGSYNHTWAEQDRLRGMHGTDAELDAMKNRGGRLNGKALKLTKEPSLKDTLRLAKSKLSKRRGYATGGAPLTPMQQYAANLKASGMPQSTIDAILASQTQQAPAAGANPATTAPVKAAVTTAPATAVQPQTAAVAPMPAPVTATPQPQVSDLLTKYYGSSNQGIADYINQQVQGGAYTMPQVDAWLQTPEAKSWYTSATAPAPAVTPQTAAVAQAAPTTAMTGVPATAPTTASTLSTQSAQATPAATSIPKGQPITRQFFDQEAYDAAVNHYNGELQKWNAIINYLSKQANFDRNAYEKTKPQPPFQGNYVKTITEQAPSKEVMDAFGRSIVGRPVTDDELKLWNDYVNNGFSNEQIVGVMSTSPEAANYTKYQINDMYSNATGAPLPKEQIDSIFNDVGAGKYKLSQLESAWNNSPQADAYRQQNLNDLFTSATGLALTPDQSASISKDVQAGKYTLPQLEQAWLASQPGIDNSRKIFANEALGRDLNPQEMQAWQSYVDAGQTPADQSLRNQQVQDAMVNSQLINDTFEGYGIEPTPEQTQKYLNALNDGSMNLDQVDKSISELPGAGFGEIIKPYQVAGKTTVPKGIPNTPAKIRSYIANIPAEIQETGRKLLSQAMDGLGITDPNIRNVIGANVQVETGFGPGLEKSYANTSNKRIQGIFSETKGMSNSELNKLKSDDQAFFNKVYGHKNGNQGGNDGYNYRGRGSVQLTGKGNYLKYGDLAGYGDALVKNPDLMLDPEVSAKVSVAYMKDMLEHSKGKTPFDKITKGVNAYGPTVAQKRAVYKTLTKDSPFNTKYNNDTKAPPTTIPPDTNYKYGKPSEADLKSIADFLGSQGIGVTNKSGLTPGATSGFIITQPNTRSLIEYLTQSGAGGNVGGGTGSTGAGGGTGAGTGSVVPSTSLGSQPLAGFQPLTFSQIRQIADQGLSMNQNANYLQQIITPPTGAYGSTPSPSHMQNASGSHVGGGYYAGHTGSGSSSSSMSGGVTFRDRGGRLVRKHALKVANKAIYSSRKK